jgi:hypothetical protein
LEKHDIDGISIDELWNLHLEVSGLLRKRLTEKLSAVEQWLRALRPGCRPSRPSKKQP